MITINLLLFVLALWIAVSLNYSFIQPALKNSKIFRLLNLRYRLYYLAMKGRISEDSPEYILLADLMNKTIRASSSFKVTDFLIFLSRLPDDEKIANSINEIIGTIQNNSTIEYCEIASDYFDVLLDIIRDYTFLLRFIIKPILVVFESFIFFRDFRDEVQRRISRIESAYAKFDQYKDEFSDLCSC